MRAVLQRARTTILFAIPSMGVGGSERVFLHLLRNLDTDRFELHLALLEATGAYLPEIPPYIPVHNLVVRHARQAILPLAKLGWKLRPRIILSTSAHMNSAVIAARRLMPGHICVLAREGADLYSPVRAYGRARLWAYKRVYRWADTVICQSEYMRAELIRRFALAPSKVVRIYNPVAIADVRGLATALPNPYHGPGPHLVSVGRFTPEKGFDVLLHCMPHVRASLHGASLSILGDGPDSAALQALRRSLRLDSCVRFLGVRLNPYPFIKNADCLVLPSRSEALPNVVLEALALGTPVAASNCTPALAEVCGYTQRMLVAKDTSPEKLSDTIVRSLAAFSRQPKQPTEPRFEAQFNVRVIVDQYERVFRERISSSVEAGGHQFTRTTTA